MTDHADGTRLCLVVVAEGSDGHVSVVASQSQALLPRFNHRLLQLLNLSGLQASLLLLPLLVGTGGKRLIEVDGTVLHHVGEEVMAHGPLLEVFLGVFVDQAAVVEWVGRLEILGSDIKLVPRQWPSLR